MGEATAQPIAGGVDWMGFAALHPSYATVSLWLVAVSRMNQ